MTPTAADAGRPPFLHTLNTFRFLCCLHIIAAHVLQDALVAVGLPAWLIVLACSSGGASTQFFFILSGFIIAYALRPGEAPGRRIGRRLQMTLPFFLLSIGLVALYQLGMALCGSSRYTTTGVSADLLSSLVLIGPFFGELPPLNGPAWAMIVFIGGYLTIGLAGDRLARQTERFLLALLLLAIATSMLANILASTLWADAGVRPYRPERTYTGRQMALHIFPLLRYLEILAGIALGNLVRRWTLGTAPVPAAIRFAGRWFGPLLALHLALLTTLCLWTGQTAFLATHGLLLPSAVLLTAALAGKRDVWLSIGRTWVMAYGATISIALYFLHMPLWQIYGELVHRFVGLHAKDHLLLVAVYLVLLVLAAAAAWESYRFLFRRARTVQQESVQPAALP